MSVNYPRLVRIATEDFSHSGYFGAFNGMMDWVIFDNKSKGAPIIKMIFSLSGIKQLKDIVAKISSDVEAKPIELSKYLYNKDTKNSDFLSSITIGRESDKSIYIESYGVAHKTPIRMPLITDKTFRINGNELSKHQLTEQGAKALIEVLSTAMPIACLTSRNNAPTNNTKTSNINNDDEVPF